MLRRHVASDDLAFLTTWCPAGTTIETLVGVEGHRWSIEDSFKTTMNELRLDRNATHSWHVSLVMLAAIRTRVNATPLMGSNNAAELPRWSVQEIRRVVIRLRAVDHISLKKHNRDSRPTDSHF